MPDSHELTRLSNDIPEELKQDFDVEVAKNSAKITGRKDQRVILCAVLDEGVEMLQNGGLEEKIQEYDDFLHEDEENEEQ